MGVFGQQCRRVRPVTAFSETIAKAYAVDGGAIDLGRGVHEANLELEAVVRLPLATMNRHGLIAGATGTGKTRTLQLLAEQLSDAGVSVFAADYKGDLSGLGQPGAADGPAPKRMAELQLAVRADVVPGRVPRARRHRRRRPGPGDGDRLRAGAARQGPGCQRDAAADPVAALPLRRRARADPDRSRGPAGAPHLPRLGRGQGRPDRHRRRLRPDDRRPAALARRARGRRRQRVLRRAALRDRRPPSHSARRSRRDQCARALGGPGPARALLDRADVAARGALPAAPRGRRPRQAEARVLLRRGAPAVCGCDEVVPGVGDADGAA